MSRKRSSVSSTVVLVAFGGLFSCFSGLAVDPVAGAADPPAGGETAVEASPFVVTGDDVFVRSGPADSYYPVTKFRRGTVVKAMDRTNRYFRVRTEGPAFAELFGYIRYPASETEWFRLSADGRSGVALEANDLVAPNLATGHRPKDSWKRMLRIRPNDRFEVIETTREEKFVTHKVKLPTTAEVWISERFLRPATATEAAALLAPVGGGPVLARNEERTAAPSAVPAATPRPVAPGTMPAPAAATPVTPAPSVPAEAEAVIVVETTTPEVEMGAPTGVSDQTADPERSPKERLAGLEAAYARLQAEPLESAEVEPLRALYLELAESAAVTHPGQARYASARADQLAMWAQLQARRARLADLESKVGVTAAEATDGRLAAEVTGGYVAVGRLASSTIFAGDRLPRLLRLQDAATGRTIAYVRPDDRGFDLDGMLGQLIGVVGTRTYDRGIRLNVIEPKRIDLLAPAANRGGGAT